MRRLTFKQLSRMTEQEVADYWAFGVLPEIADVRTFAEGIGSFMSSRSELESAERAWAKGEGQ